MKSKKYIIPVLFSGALMLGASACTGNYEEINTNPYEATEDDMNKDGYKISSTMVAMQGWVIPTDVNAYQFAECLLGGSYGGYLADSNNGFNEGKFSTYNPQQGWIKVMFDDFIPKIYSNLTKLRQSTTDPVPLAVADIIKVLSIQRVTDCYGPIPYSKIGADGTTATAYDSQKDVYTAMFAELDAAILTLTDHRTETFSANADKIYQGNVENWIKLANSMKLRMAMRIVYADPTTAQTKAEEAVNHVVGVFTTNADNARLVSFGKDGNPLSKVVNEYNGGDSRASADIVSYMNGYKDPRMASYFKSSTFAAEDLKNSATNGFHGLRSGIVIPAKELVQKYSNVIVSSTTPLQWMNASEVTFLRAEGALRGWNMKGTDKALYEEAIRLSFEQWGVGEADKYYTNNTNVPLVYKDPTNQFSYDKSTSSITIAYEGSDFEKNLERIITQKWIANFPIGQEAWAEFRRTGYPRFMEVVANLSSGGSVNSSEMARRLPYPQSEYLLNADNVKAAIQMLNPKIDNMGAKVWWDCKPIK